MTSTNGWKRLVCRFYEKTSRNFGSTAGKNINISCDSFQQNSCGKFLNNLEPFLAIDPSRIYNVDETGISTVARLSKILAKRGKARVAVATSGERGTNTTVICCISATGSFVPPMFIFKRLRKAEHIINDAPVGSIEDCSKSGSVNEDLFENNSFILKILPSALLKTPCFLLLTTTAVTFL